MVKAKESEISVVQLDVGRMDCYILGSTPIILNRMANKIDLLAPHRKKNAAEKASSLKHDPIAEFRASPYRAEIAGHDTLLAHLTTAFKGAICGAALDMPGASKAQMGRLVHVEDEYVPIYGLPRIHMCVVRSADINHTPDIRTRCVVPGWATKITIRFVRPLVNETTVGNLLAAAGMIQGVGDFRPGKGKGTFGQFEIVGADDARWQRIVKATTRASQEAAMKTAEPYDDETAELLAQFDAEMDRRGVVPPSAKAV